MKLAAGEVDDQRVAGVERWNDLVSDVRGRGDVVLAGQRDHGDVAGALDRDPMRRSHQPGE